MPLVDATPATLDGHGCLVDDRRECRIEITRWPAIGSRPVDADTGDQGGTTEGVFVSDWRGDILYGHNEAVDGHYILGYARAPETARTDHVERPRRLLLWHANYHPDGGQLFFPLQSQPFYVPLALPGDDVTPQRFACFRFDGQQGLYIHPNIWHEGVFGLSGRRDCLVDYESEGPAIRFRYTKPVAFFISLLCTHPVELKTLSEDCDPLLVALTPHEVVLLSVRL
jgi:hypothetical protein